MLIPTNTGRLSTRRLLCTWIAAKSSSKILARANAGLAMRRLSLSSSCERTSFTSTRFRRFWDHGLPEDRVVHQLVEVLLKAADGLLPELSIHPDVWLHPMGSGRSGGHDWPQSDGCPETCTAADCDSGDIALLVAEVWDQLLNLCWRRPNAEKVVLIVRHPLLLNHHALRCQRICIVRVV